MERPRPAPPFGAPGRRKKGSKIRSDQVGGNARAAVEDVDLGAASPPAPHLHFDGSGASVPAGVLEEVAEEAAEEPRASLHGDDVPRERSPRAGALLGGERRQVDLLERLVGGSRLEPAREEDLLHEVVQLGDVARDLLLQVRVALQETRRHAHPPEGTPELVRGVREEPALRADELLDAPRGPVEARGEERDLVPPLHR